MPRRPASHHRGLVEDRLSRLDEGYQERARRWRRAEILGASVVLVLVLLVATADGVGLVDAVGVDSSTARATAGGTTLEVRHPDVTRPALAGPFEIRIVRADGFGGEPVEVAVSTDYLQLWDLNGILPAPSEETADGERVIWTFEPPPGDELVIVYEARIEPAVQSGAPARVAVLDEQGGDEVAVEFETRVRP